MNACDLCNKLPWSSYHKVFFPIVLVLGLFSRGWTDGFNGPVVFVLDGDTIEVLHNTYPERIRLSGLDCSMKRLGLVTLCAGRPLPSLTAVWVLSHPS